jgi:hypothetical protein
MQRNKLKVLLVLGVVLSASSLLAIRTAFAQEKNAEESAWKKEFREKYGLKDGEHIKRIATPYPQCRSEYMASRVGASGDSTSYDNYFTVLGWKDGWAPGRLARHTLSVRPEKGLPLAGLLSMVAGIPPTRIDGVKQSEHVTGDFVVRDGSTPAQIVAQLQTILNRECNLPVTLEFKDVELDVFVLAGKYETKPLEGRKKNEIEVYAKHLVGRDAGGGGSGTFDELLAHLERHVSVPVLAGKIEGPPKNIRWHDNVRPFPILDPIRRPKAWAEDHEAVMVLDNISSQTGLTVKTEKRKVRVLVVEDAKTDK